MVAHWRGDLQRDPRGIFVLDTDGHERARQLAETDPGFRAGMFVFSFHTLSTEAALRAQLAAELAHLEEVERSGRTPAPGEGGRGYVLLTAASGAAAAQALASHPAVLMFARLDGERALVLLDAKDSADASRLLAPLADKLGAFQLDDWFGSGLLVGLPKLR